MILSVAMWLAMWLADGHKQKVDEAYRAKVEVMLNKASQGKPVEVYRRGDKLAVVGPGDNGVWVLMVLEPQSEEMVIRKGPLMCKP